VRSGHLDLNAQHVSARLRAEAVRLVLSGVAVSRVAKDLGVNDQAIRNWVKQHQVGHGKVEGLTTTALAELSQLRRENRVLRQERVPSGDPGAVATRREDNPCQGAARIGRASIGRRWQVSWRLDIQNEATPSGDESAIRPPGSQEDH